MTIAPTSVRPSIQPAPPARRRGAWPLRAAALYPLLLLALNGQGILRPVRGGPLALAEIFAPYLFAPLLLLVPLGFLRRATVLRILLALCAVVFVGRFVVLGRLALPAAPPGTVPVEAVTWNVDMANADLAGVRAVLATRPAAVVSLPEAHGGDILRDAALGRVYPFRVVAPSLRGDSDVVLLSVYPIRESSLLDLNRGAAAGPQIAWARLDLGGGHRLTVVATHPINEAPDGCDAPACYDPASRDAAIAAIPAFLAPRLATGAPLLLLGDFNVTDREPAYGTLSAGLQDAFRRTGLGLGATWAPLPVTHHGLPLLRIDYLFSTPAVVPLHTSVDCTWHGSDHCLVHGRFAVP